MDDSWFSVTTTIFWRSIRKSKNFYRSFGIGRRRWEESWSVWPWVRRKSKTQHNPVVHIWNRSNLHIWESISIASQLLKISSESVEEKETTSERRRRRYVWWRWRWWVCWQLKYLYFLITIQNRACEIWKIYSSVCCNIVLNWECLEEMVIDSLHWNLWRIRIKHLCTTIFHFHLIDQLHLITISSN